MGRVYLQWADSPRMRELLKSVPELSQATDREVPGTLVLIKN